MQKEKKKLEHILPESIFLQYFKSIVSLNYLIMKDIKVKGTKICLKVLLTKNK